MCEEKRCERCDELIAIHKKCKYCKILLHEEKKEYQCRCGRQHGKFNEFDPEYCEECWFELFNK